MKLERLIILILAFMFTFMLATRIYDQPAIEKWRKLLKIERLQAEVTNAYQVISGNHIEADSIRKSLGLITEQQQPSKSWVIELQPLQVVDQLLNNTLTWH